MKETLFVLLTMLVSTPSTIAAEAPALGCFELREQALHEMNRLRRHDETRSPKIYGEKLLKKAAEACTAEAKATEDREAAAFLALEAAWSRHRLAHRAGGSKAARASLVDSIFQIESLHHDASPALIPLLRKLSITVSDDEPQYAVALMQRALDVAERQRGPESREVAEVLTDFGFLYAPRTYQGAEKRPLEDIETAESLLRRSIEIYLRQENLTDLELDGLKAPIGHLMMLLRGEGRLDEAAEFESFYSEAKREEDRLKAGTEHRGDKAGH